MSEKALADYTLEERHENLKVEMAKIGAEYVSTGGADMPCAPSLTFTLAQHGHDKPLRMQVRIMLNQWDVCIFGPNTVEEGHDRGDAAGVANWLLSSAQLNPKERPLCQEVQEGEVCGYLNAYLCADRVWRCFYHKEEREPGACFFSLQPLPAEVMKDGAYGIARAWCPRCKTHVDTTGDGVTEAQTYVAHKKATA